MTAFFLFWSLCGLPPEAPRQDELKDEIVRLEMLCQQCDHRGLEKTLSELNDKYDARGSAAYVHALSRIVIAVQMATIGHEPAFKTLVTKYADIVVGKVGEKETTAEFCGDQLAAFVEVYCRLEFAPRMSDKERAAHAVALLTKWDELATSIAHYSPYDPVKPAVKIKPYFPPPSYTGSFTFGESPEGISDPTVRREYAEFLKKRNEFVANSVRLQDLRSLQKEYHLNAAEHLARLYASQPAGQAAVMQLIKDNIRDKQVAADLIQLVRTALAQEKKARLGAAQP